MRNVAFQLREFLFQMIAKIPISEDKVKISHFGHSVPLNFEYWQFIITIGNNYISASKQ